MDILERKIIDINGTATDLNTQIHPNDDMWKGDPNINNYFYCGENIIHEIKNIISFSKNNINSILDFPCGHGRVLRYLKAYFPDSKISVCDIDKEGVDFCTKTFNVDGYYSSNRVSEIKIKDKFDLIWCGSLLTHLDAGHWTEFLSLFNSLLNPGGILIFTTHGRAIEKEIMSIPGGEHYNIISLRNYRASGFGYQDYENITGYGSSISSLGWVMNKITKFDTWKVIYCNESGWCRRQDVISVMKY